MAINNTEYKHELIIPNESIPAHWHRSAEIFYVRRGKLNIWMNKKKYELGRNDFIYINSKEVHSTQSPEDNEVIVLQITGDFLETFSNKESLSIHCNTLELEENIEISTQKYLDRLSEICEYIKLNYQDNLTLNEVAEENGFSNVKSLNKLFKEVYGLSPTAYRKNIKK